jgi:hypothetical protein
MTTRWRDIRGKNPHMTPARIAEAEARLARELLDRCREAEAAARSDDVTPPLCRHCARLMQFASLQPSVVELGQWEEHWRCPEGQWLFHRTVAPPPTAQIVPTPTKGPPVTWRRSSSRDRRR